MNNNVIEKLRIEYEELRIKADKLYSFMYTKVFKELSEYHKNLMISQYSYMEKYLKVLHLRINDIVENEKDVDKCCCEYEEEYQEIQEMITENFYNDEEKLCKTITTIKYK